MSILHFSIKRSILTLTFIIIWCFYGYGVPVFRDWSDVSNITIKAISLRYPSLYQSAIDTQTVSTIDSIDGENLSEEISQVRVSPSVQTEDPITPGYHDLGEIVVVASREMRLRDGIAYIPDKTQKKFSNDGMSLLARMMIPSLRVNLIDKSVKTASGKAVRIFINGLPASEEEVDALYPEDVNKVEILDHPTDSRFLGEEHVINYIVTKYLWGGYTKVNANGGGPAWRGGGFINSGLTYKRMTYNLYVNSNYNQDFTNSRSVQTLNLGDEHYSIETNNDRPKGRTTSEMGYFSVLYQTDKVMFKNKISFTHELTPWRIGSGKVIYKSPYETIDAISHSGLHSMTLTPAWEGNLSVNFPHSMALSVYASTLFRLNNSHHQQDEYRNSDLIFNNNYKVNETGNRSSLDIFFNKKFNDNHIFSLRGAGTYNLYNLKYIGTVGDDNRIESIFSMLATTYTFQWNTGRIEFDLQAYYKRSAIRSTDFSLNEWSPGGSINFIWNPAQNQQVSADVSYVEASFPLEQINPTRIQRNLWICEEGNPNLSSPSGLLFNLNYNWWTPKVAIHAFLYGEFSLNTMYQTAFQNQDTHGITLGYENGVDWRVYTLGTNITWHITQEFAIGGVGSIVNINKTAPLNQHKYRVEGGLQGFWSHNHFSVYLSLYSNNPINSFMGYGCMDMMYSAGATATYGNWNINLSVNNPFKRKKSYSQWGNTPNHIYTFNNTTYSRLSTTDISLSVTYTIRYGRKQQNQTIEGITNDQSLMK